MTRNKRPLGLYRVKPEADYCEEPIVRYERGRSAIAMLAFLAAHPRWWVCYEPWDGVFVVTDHEEEASLEMVEQMAMNPPEDFRQMTHCTCADVFLRQLRWTMCRHVPHLLARPFHAVRYRLHRSGIWPMYRIRPSDGSVLDEESGEHSGH